MGYLGGKAIDDIVAGPFRFGAPPTGQPAPLRDVLLASGRATDREGLRRFQEAVDDVLLAAKAHQILYAIVVIAAAQTRRAADPYVTIVLPGHNLRTAVTKLKPAVVPFADAKGLTFNPPPPAVFAVDERDPEGSPTNQRLNFAATLIHEFTHVALVRVYGNDSLPWYPDDEQKGRETDAYKRVGVLMQRFRQTPGKLAHPDYVEPAGSWLVDRFNQILDDWHGLPSGFSGKLNSESVPYLIEGTFLSLRHEKWDLFSSSADINLTDYQRLVWPDLLAGEATARGENTVVADAYPGVQRIY